MSSSVILQPGYIIDRRQDYIWFIGLPLGFVLSEGIIFPGLAPGVYGYWAAQTLGLTLVAGAMGFRLWHISANSQKILKLAGT